MTLKMAMVMSHRLNRLRGIVFTPRVPPFCNLLDSPGSWMLNSGRFSTALFDHWPRIRCKGDLRMTDHVRRCSVSSEISDDLHSGTRLLNFFRFAFDQLEGPNHCWLNYNYDSTKFLKRGRLFFVFVHEAAEDFMLLSPHELNVHFKKIKLLQQRYPELNVFALQSSTSVDSIANHAKIIQTIMEEFITFPILLLQKKFVKDLCEMKDGGFFLLFEESTNNLLQLNLDLDLHIIVKAIEEFIMLQKDAALLVQNVHIDKTRKLNVLKEPCVHSFRNLFLYHPGCVSVDEEGSRLFISDSNHHRIIISDDEGKLLDCIGSSPGFEDGEFQSAKLFRPAASFFCPIENCLYFVDSENHAVRKADMDKRVVETLVPACIQKNSGIWTWILDKFGFTSEVVGKTEELDSDLIKFPWHLVITEENDLLIIDRSFETSWVISMTTWETKKIIKGISSIMDVYGHLIMDKVTLLKDISNSCLLERFENCLTIEMIPYAGLLSSVANFHNYIILCDAAGQSVLKCHKGTWDISSLSFSNLGILGLPYWMICPLEKVFNGERFGRSITEHVHHFSVLPGRCNIQVFVNIPKASELVEPLEEGCIWRQVRGSGSELSGYEGVVDGRDKVGVAQQWFDELDNLAFSQDTEESNFQVKQLQDKKFQDKDKIHFGCAVNISPGTCEVIISTVLYLKLKKTLDTGEEPSSAILKILDHQSYNCPIPEDDASIKLLSETFIGVREMIFMKPLHIRLRLQCADHPPAESNKETIFTDSTITFPLSLD